MNNKLYVIYLMGTGRSGTTALATFLGNNKDILTIGEMHQFFEHIENNKNCSCGKTLKECEFWSKILENLPQEFIDNAGEYRKFCEQFEYHTAIIKNLFNLYKNDEFKRYIEIQETIFNVINNINKSEYMLDSAKYIGRALSLKKSKKLNIKIIYVVRDVRGVINSFSKKVQTSRSPLSALIYWNIINFFGEIIYRLRIKEKILKLKYEDFILSPIKELERIEIFLGIDLSDVKDKINNNYEFYIPHIIGGNRLKTNKKIKFKQDLSWRDKCPKFLQIIYYFMSPMMWINRFKI